jgi:hypothetical protein
MRFGISLDLHEVQAGDCLREVGESAAGKSA